jgi:hypothetical protein
MPLRGWLTYVSRRAFGAAGTIPQSFREVKKKRIPTPGPSMVGAKKELDLRGNP